MTAPSRAETTTILYRRPCPPGRTHDPRWPFRPSHSFPDLLHFLTPLVSSSLFWFTLLAVSLLPSVLYPPLILCVVQSYSAMFSLHRNSHNLLGLDIYMTARLKANKESL